MPAALTVAKCCELSGVDVVTDSPITDASDIIHRDTGLTPSEWVDDREVPVGLVQRAWSIVAARLYTFSRASDTEGVTSETQGDYSYTADLGTVEQYRADPLHGLPRTLLGEASAEMYRLRPGGYVAGIRY